MEETTQVNGTGVSEAEIGAYWLEEDYVYPSEEFVRNAYVQNQTFLNKFKEENFPECFHEYANLLSWDRYWRWFVGGKLNACYNCVDRHLDMINIKIKLQLFGFLSQ